MMVAIVAIVAVAAFLRLYNLGYDSIGHDEGGRVNWTHHGALAESRRLPPLNTLTFYTLQHFVGRSEFIVRLPSALAGIALVLFLYLFVRRLVDQRAAVLVSALVACHPVM